MGMNPGPWGMAQTGVPFGEINFVRDWIGINESVARPEHEHPKRKIEGFACQRSEVSGRRFWGLFQEKFEKCDLFFEDHFVANFCPLVFMEETGRNRTPDKLPKVEKEALDQFCQEHRLVSSKYLSPNFWSGWALMLRSSLNMQQRH